MSLTETTGKLTQLHPEDLFDKEARGTLTDSEHERLEMHVAQCAACKMDRLLRADFADDESDRISYSNLVEGALGAVAKGDALPTKDVPTKELDAPSEPLVPAASGASSEKSSNATGRAPVRTIAPWKRFALLFAAAFVLLATVAAASERGRALARRATSMLSSSNQAREKELSAPKPSTTATQGPLAAFAPATVEPTPLEPTPAPSPTAPAEPTVNVVSEAPRLTAAPVADRGVPHVAPSQQGSARQSVGPISNGKPIAVAPSAEGLPAINVAATEPVAQDATTLFGAANEKRRSGNVQGALAAYADVIERFPSSREAATAHALRGRILLEQRDARRALSEFDTYLANGRGELREEALVGRARAFGLLGKADAERTAWQELLASYPRSASAEHAKLRIEAIGLR